MMTTRVLLADADMATAHSVERRLAFEGFECTIVSDGRRALQEVASNDFDLVLLEVMLPGVDGFEVCRRIRAKPSLQGKPVILLTTLGHEPEVLHGFEQGADDYVVKPFNYDELVGRAKALLHRRRLKMEANPVAALPGDAEVRAELQRRIENEEKFAYYVFDLDGFKSYNKAFGFEAGDRVIRALASIVAQSVERVGAKRPFLGHLGGDDFVLLTEIGMEDRLCREVLKEFEAQVRAFYPEDDVRRGFAETRGRRGEVVRNSLVTISIGATNNLNRDLGDPRLVAEVAAEVKRKAKTIPGNSYYLDQRRA